MMKKRKCIAGFLILVLTAGVFLSACSGNKPEPPANEVPKTTEAAGTASASDSETFDDPVTETTSVEVADDITQRVHLTWYLPFSWWDTNWNGEVQQYVMEKTGVDLELDVPVGDGNERLNMMMAANDLPDIVSAEWWYPPALTELKSGFLLPLEPLIEEAGAYSIWDNVGSVVLERWRFEDGELYTIPSFYYNLDAFPPDRLPGMGFLAVRKDIYEAIGSPAMWTSPDDFIEACRMAVDAYPEVDGMPLIPMLLMGELNGSNWSQVSDMVTQSFNAFFTIKEDAIEGRPTRQRENTKDMFFFINRMVREGFILPDALTDRQTQIDEYAASGRVFIAQFMNDIPLHMQEAAERFNTEYIPIISLHNSKGEPPRKQTDGGGGFGWFETFISTNCNDPISAIKFLEYLSSMENQLMGRYGLQGVHWDYDANGEVELKPETIEALLTGDTDFQEAAGIGWAKNLIQNNFDIVNPLPAITPERVLDIMHYRTMFTIDDRALISVQGPSDSEDQYNVNARIINEEWTRTIPLLVLAESDAEFNDIWNSYNEYIDNNGAIENFQKLVQYTIELEDHLGMTTLVR